MKDDSPNLVERGLNAIFSLAKATSFGPNEPKLKEPRLESVAGFKSHYGINGGDQWIYSFPNGYGASVVMHSFSYGRSDGLFELAVLHGNKLTHETPITDDVIGNLSVDEVLKTLADIAALPKEDD